MERKIPVAAEKAIGYVDALNAKNFKTYEEYEAGIDAISEKIKADIMYSESDYDASKKTFYISNSGDDNNDGLTPETSWKTLDKVNNPESTCDNCNVLFERGGLWRGVLKPAHDGMTFSAYGVGQKPRFYGSKMNYAKPEYWQKTEWQNVWVTDLCTKNVGLVAFNHGDVYGNYKEIMGYRCVKNNNFTGPKDMKQNYEFHGDLDEPRCYIYCDKGNPGEVYDSLELGEGFTLMTANGKNDLKFDNICIKYVGCHAIAGLGGRHNITVQNCVFCYLGGSILDGFAGRRDVGFGNAVETYGPCNGYYVNSNWIYQIYDTGITHQYSQGSKTDCRMNDVEYIGNLIEYTHWSIEFYNQPSEGTKRSVHNTDIHHNVLRKGAMGWGSRGRESGGALFNSFVLPEDTENFLTHDNIYDTSAGNLVRLNRGGDEKIISYNNTYIQKNGGALGWIWDGTRPFNDDAVERIEEYCHEKDARVFFVK